MNFMVSGLRSERATTILLCSLALDEAGRSMDARARLSRRWGNGQGITLIQAHSQQNAFPHLPILKILPSSKAQISAKLFLTFPIPTPES